MKLVVLPSVPIVGQDEYHGTFSIYANLQVAHAPGMPGKFSPPPRVSDPDMHNSMCVTQVSFLARVVMLAGIAD